MHERILNIFEFQYKKDNFGSCHRIIAQKEYKKTLSYYKNHIYIDGEFEKNDNWDENVADLESKFNNDIKRMEDVFHILDIWDVHFNSATNLLDIGCGYGYFLDLFVNRFSGRAFGIDLSSMAIKLSKILNPNITIRQYDVNSVGNILNDEKINIVIALDILEHLMDYRRLINTLFHSSGEYLKVVVEIPIIHPNFSENELKNYKYLYPTRHLHLFTPKGIIHEFKSVGFQLENSTFFKNEFKYLFYFIKKLS